VEIQPIDIQDLELDLHNYRLNPQPDQRAAVREMILLQGSKLVTIAKDILAIGVSPFDLPMVTPSEDNPNVYTVLEGNRRVAALKCVHEPNLANETSQHKAFVELNKLAPTAPYELLCSIVSSKEAAFEFIRRKHDTGLEGAGTETWTAVMKERAAADQGRGTPTHNALEFVLKNADLDPAIRDEVSGHKFPITNLRRILESTAKVKTVLGLEPDEKTRSFKTSADKGWTLDVLTEMVTTVASGRFNGKPFNVRDIIDKTQREQFLNEVIAKHPKPAGRSAVWSVNATTEVATKISPSKPRIRLNPHTIDRKFLIPVDCRLKIPSGKANDIYDELRRKIEVQRSPNAAGILFRVFIEFSAEHYIRQKGVAMKPAPKGGDHRLVDKLKAIIKDMEAKNVLTSKEMAKISQMISNPSSLVSVYTLNQYVHNPNLIPSASELKSSWSSIQLFIEKCWL